MAKASGTTRASRPSSVGAGMPTQGFLLRDAAAVRKYENTYKQVVQRGGGLKVNQLEQRQTKHYRHISVTISKNLRTILRRR